MRGGLPSLRTLFEIYAPPQHRFIQSVKIPRNTRIVRHGQVIDCRLCSSALLEYFHSLIIDEKIFLPSQPGNGDILYIMPIQPLFKNTCLT